MTVSALSTGSGLRRQETEPAEKSGDPFRDRPALRRWQREYFQQESAARTRGLETLKTITSDQLGPTRSAERAPERRKAGRPRASWPLCRSCWREPRKRFRMAPTAGSSQGVTLNQSVVSLRYPPVRGAMDCFRPLHPHNPHAIDRLPPTHPPTQPAAALPQYHVIEHQKVTRSASLR